MIKIYQLNRLTHGIACASFLCIRTLHQLAVDESTAQPLAASSLKQDFYVDDLLTDSDTREQAIALRDNLIKILSKGRIKVAKLFDPLGLLGPIIVQAKIIIQLLSKANVNWDESIPIDIHTSWIEYMSQLPLFNELRFGR